MTRPFDLPITPIDLAECVGMTSVHVNRTLRELRGEQVVEFQIRPSADKGSARKLQAIADFDPGVPLSGTAATLRSLVGRGLRPSLTSIVMRQVANRMVTKSSAPRRTSRLAHCNRGHKINIDLLTFRHYGKVSLHILTLFDLAPIVELETSEPDIKTYVGSPCSILSAPLLLELPCSG